MGRSFLEEERRINGFDYFEMQSQVLKIDYCFSPKVEFSGNDDKHKHGPVLQGFSPIRVS